MMTLFYFPISHVLVLFLFCVPSLVRPSSDPLYEKADQYDQWNFKFHQPYYGGIVQVTFTDTSYKTPQDYSNYPDSAIWTGVYLGSQCFRYAVTKEESVRQRALRTVKALHHFLKVTNTTGYIARYLAPRNSLVYKGDKWCQQRVDCHIVKSGVYKDDFYISTTSKDQYSGWFFGMGIAYDLLDSEEAREIIRSDVAEIVDKLIASNWLILDERGQHIVFSAIHRPTYVFQMSWLLMAYHMTNKTKYLDEVNSRLSLWSMLTESISSHEIYTNKYFQYYSHHLGQITWYNLLRLSKTGIIHKYWHEGLLKLYRNIIHESSKLSHNPFFSSIYLSTFSDKEMMELQSHKEGNPYIEQIKEDLSDFRNCPNFMYKLKAKDPKEYTKDPYSSWVEYFPWLKQFLESIRIHLHAQAKEAFRVSQQCPSGFLFQNSPYEFKECGADRPKHVNPGVDYLVAYWMARYYKII